MIENNCPLVSIGVPFYNSEKYIIHTLESIRSQTYNNIELILINDCSPDGSQSIVDDWLSINRGFFSNVIELSNHQNRGLAYSCKALQQAATGTYFSKLDSDDIILPSKITAQVDCLNSNPEMAMVYSNAMLIDSEGHLFELDYFEKQEFKTVRNKIGPSGFVFTELLLEDFIPNPSVLVRKSILDVTGGYDETLFAEDWDLWLRIAKDHPIKFMEGLYSQYRIHPESIMRKSASLVKVYASLIKVVLKHQHISKEFDKIVAKHLYTYAIGLYRYGVIDKKSLKINWSYNKNFKSLMYYLCGLLNIRINQKTT